MQLRLVLLMSAGLFCIVLSPIVSAGTKSDIANSKHNLSSTSGNTVRATTEDEICVFCHTPHGASSFSAPLWNRDEPTGPYTNYDSLSMDAIDLTASPGGSSKLCLSCHDGTIAIGNVNVANGQANPADISMQGTAGGFMPVGSGTTTGFTRNLGVDLTNDHPISFTYDTLLATTDGELLDPSIPADHLATRAHASGSKPLIPLEAGKMECTSCHDPHIVDDTDPNLNIKFLRANRFQENSGPTTSFNQTNDIICLACHEKAGWQNSAHAHLTVADEQYVASEATLRDFPSSPALKVWEAACLNCHDTHTVQGARRLLREGTDDINSPKQGGDSAIEETCYQCHAATNILTGGTGTVPDIKTDFSLARHMPITTSDQPTAGTSELHDISDKDFSETQLLLGRGNTDNRHAECTDCHNPHRVTRNDLFNDDPSVPDGRGTHNHASGHTNLASGVLRGITGVEPDWTGHAAPESFYSLPTSYDVKKGNPSVGASTLVTNTYVTREYQVCLKCHSDYAYIDSEATPGNNNATRPIPGDSTGTTTLQNDLDVYTNQAREFNSPVNHRGEGTATGGGANPSGAGGRNYETNNHRGWHPVMESTGRNYSARGMSSADGHFESPWNGAGDLGNQTMYCTDCHGTNTAQNTVVPTGGKPWGPHGSTENFILKGDWDTGTGTGTNSRDNDLCFRCHDYGLYATDANNGANSGFCCDSKNNLHAQHVTKIGRVRCSWCHVAVPHGWKNKQLLVNLNDVGIECDTNTGEVCRGGNGWGGTNGGCSTNNGFTCGPYYLNAFLKVRTFRTSGNWQADDCGSATNPSGGDGFGIKWMKDEACTNPP